MNTSRSSDSVKTTDSDSTKTTNYNDHGGDDSFTDDGGSDNEQQTAFMKNINRFLKRQAKAFVRNFVDYGPPYTKERNRYELVTECSRPVMNYRELHKLLNKRWDPNIPDPEDLYYYPIHWAARNLHTMALKMLVRAGAKINVTNELGNTALDMCIMMVAPPDRRSDQIKLATFLLDKGADPNNRDKGGYSAIDHAAANNDEEVICLLLEFGANVLRVNHTLVAQRHHILRRVHDPVCYKLLYQKLRQEEEEAAQKRREREIMDREKKAEIYRIKLHQSLEKQKEKRLAKELALKVIEREEDGRSKRLLAEMESNLLRSGRKDKLQHLHGEWSKDEVDHWAFSPTAVVRVNTNMLYHRDRSLMDDLYESNRVDGYNARWKQAAGNDASLEMNWLKAAPFELTDHLTQPLKVDHQTSTSSTTLSAAAVAVVAQPRSNSMLGKAGGESFRPTVKTISTSSSSYMKPPSSFSPSSSILSSGLAALYRDENDDELQGEDLDVLMTAMTWDRK